MTPGHPLFEAIRRKVEDTARPHLQEGVVLYELQREEPSLLQVYMASVVDGTGKTLHQRLFVVETTLSGEWSLREPSYLTNLVVPDGEVQHFPAFSVEETEPLEFLYERGLQTFLKEVVSERHKDLDMVERHVRLCFEELIKKRDEILARHLIARDEGDPAAEGLIEIESQKLIDLQRRRDRRLDELHRQRALSLQRIDQIGAVLVLPHPERAAPEISSLVSNPVTEQRAMQVSIAYEQSRGCKIEDIHTQNLGYDIRSLHPETGELRLIEVKGIGGDSGAIYLTPNERRVADDRPDVYWLYIVTDCDTNPTLQEPVLDPGRLPWHEIRKVDHYQLSVNALTRPMRLSENQNLYGRRDKVDS